MQGVPKPGRCLCPVNFPARDWVLWVEFADGKVSAVRVRTSDGPPQAMLPQMSEAKPFQGSLGVAA